MPRRGRASGVASFAATAAFLFLAAFSTPTEAASNATDLAYDQPAPGGKVVEVRWEVTLGKRAPDCFSRDVLLINGRFLRNATVTLRRGDVLDITLVNALPTAYPDIEEGLSLHFHGLAMATPDGGAAWFDGVPYLHQCPVRAGGGSMRYRFRVDDGPGTFWIHAHTMQIMDGLFAPLVVLPPRGAPDPALAGAGLAGAGAVAADIPLMVGDWYHTSATGLQVGLQRPFDAAKVKQGSGGSSSSGHGGGHGGGGGGGGHDGGGTGAWVWVQQPQSVLFNGRGFFGDCPVGAAGSKTEPNCTVAALTIPPGRSAANPAATASDPGCTHEVIAVPAGATSRLRLIGTGSLAYLTLCFEGHTLTVIAADGVAVEPFNATCVDLNLGQRLDVLLTADQGGPGDVFWVSAVPQFRPGSPAGYAVLHYTDGTAGNVTGARLPSSPPLQPGSVKAWTAADQGRIVAPAWALAAPAADSGSDAPSPRAALHLPPAYRDLRPPATTAPAIRFNITQPLLEQTGQMRWALNNVATGGTPGCGAFLADAQSRGAGWVKAQAEATAAKGARADDDLLGKQTVSDANAMPTFLMGVTPALTKPAVGRLLVSVPAGTVVDLIFDNLPANANGGDYRAGPDGANRTVSEMHPLHWHGYHGWLLGTGAEGSGPYSEDADRGKLNVANPPLRDSVTILPNSWVVVRLALDAPGAWLLHCHMHSHAEMGMAVVFVAGLEAVPPQPHGGEAFPKCMHECASAAAPWTPGTVREEWGGTNYDLGPDALPEPGADGAVAAGVNASSVPE